MRRLVIVGAGGFGREVLDVIEAVNETRNRPGFLVVGVLDDAPSIENGARLAARRVAMLGTLDSWLASGDDAEYLVGVGDPAARRRLSQKFDAAGRSAATAVHPLAVVGSAGTIGAGTVVCAGVQISTNVRLGRHVHVNANATIGHDCELGDFVSVNPSATISGECVVETGALIGAAAVILQRLSVGQGAIVGAAACVVRAVPPSTTVKGVPAR